ncbi:MAG TPA: hypothetical protein EYP14_12855 [Planctomycetaceae bacterium]|nr:hypothetical protein [Planctomycetaceae bacterium]
MSGVHHDLAPVGCLHVLFTGIKPAAIVTGHLSVAKRPGRDIFVAETHVVHPGRNGPLNSIPWERPRQGIEHYGCRHRLATRTAELTMKK